MEWISYLVSDCIILFYISMHSPSVLLRDVRNIRKNNTLLLSMTSKDIGSTKDLKKARSSEQLINLKGFLDVTLYIFRTKMIKLKPSTKSCKCTKLKSKKMGPSLKN